MCVKVSDSEIDTVKALMTMSLNVIISDVFQIDCEKINPIHDLRKDLNMDKEQEYLLKSTVFEYFDGYELEISSEYTIQHLHNDVILNCFENEQ